MRRVVIAVALAAAGVAPLLRYHPSPGTASVAVAPTPSSGTGSPRSPATGATGGSARRTVDGSVVNTPYGPYQVRASFDGKRLTDIRLITVPSDGHSQSIAGYAGPILRAEALKAQSSTIDTVSGATYTSDAYRRSLQSAIDAAWH